MSFRIHQGRFSKQSPLTHYEVEYHTALQIEMQRFNDLEEAKQFAQDLLKRHDVFNTFVRCVRVNGVTSYHKYEVSD